MAELKKRVLVLSNGRQIKLFGNSIGISKSLELGEIYAPNVLSVSVENASEHNAAVVSNAYKLTEAEVFEIADYYIRLWIDLKDAVRKHGVNSVKIFNREGML